MHAAKSGRRVSRANGGDVGAMRAGVGRTASTASPASSHSSAAAAQDAVQLAPGHVWAGVHANDHRSPLPNDLYGKVSCCY